MVAALPIASLLAGSGSAVAGLVGATGTAGTLASLAAGVGAVSTIAGGFSAQAMRHKQSVETHR